MKNSIGWGTLAILSSVLFVGCHTPTTPPSAPVTPAPAVVPSTPEPPAPVAKSGPAFETTRDWFIATLQQYGGYVKQSGSVDVPPRSSTDIGFTNILISNSGLLTYTRTDAYMHQMPGHNHFYNAGFTFHRKIPLGAITDIQVVIKTNMNYLDDSYTTTPYLSIKTGNIAAIQGDSVIQKDSEKDKDSKSIDYFEKNELGEGNNGYDGLGLSSKSSDAVTLEINRTPEAIPGQPMPDDSETMARRLATALQHLADICKDTYKVPPQAPPPF